MAKNVFDKRREPSTAIIAPNTGLLSATGDTQFLRLPLIVVIDTSYVPHSIAILSALAHRPFSCHIVILSHLATREWLKFRTESTHR